MTEEEMQKIVDLIVEELFKRFDAEAKAMNEEFIHELPSNEEQIKELSLLLKYYEKVEDYTHAANVFAHIKRLKNNE